VAATWSLYCYYYYYYYYYYFFFFFRRSLPPPLPPQPATKTNALAEMLVKPSLRKLRRVISLLGGVDILPPLS